METTCEIITDFRHLEELSACWDCWWRANPRGEIFQSFAWARAWWKCFGGSVELCTPVVHENGEPVLILPLVRRGRDLVCLGTPQSDYCDFLSSHPRPEEPLALAFEALLHSKLSWRECKIENLPPWSRMLAAAPKLRPRLQALMQVTPTESCPTIVLGERREQVLEDLTGKKHTRRRINKLNKAGRLNFRHIEDQAEAQEQLTKFFQSHLERCALLGKTSSFEDPAMCEFMRELMRQCDLRKEVRFSVVELNNQGIAWSIGFLIHGKFDYYQQTFSVAAEEYAPGEVLMYFLLEFAKKNVDREFDFMRGEEFFKRRFATEVRQSCTLYLERPGPVGELRREWRSLQARSYNTLGRWEVGLRAHPIFPKMRSVLVWVRKRRKGVPSSST
jgi:CelD/BcsL family acetyltransferase involved in cellulose biosynthesis